ncbi:MAG: flagellar assembly protein H, partial [Leptolyngbyaceae bacterium]|nr:flagellar assembly protein H [Leptolyngbyaceae bacterium]
MTRTPFDSFAKQYFEELLSPWGRVEINREVPGESRFVDVWFAPASPSQARRDDWGLLGQMTTTPCLLEPYRNPPKLPEIRSCLLKLLWVQADYQRQSRRDEDPLLEADLPQLWILVPTASESLL